MKICDTEQKLDEKISHISACACVKMSFLLVAFHSKLKTFVMAPGKRKSYTLEFKLHALDVLHKRDGNVSATARQLSVSRRVVERWRAQENELRHLKRRVKKTW